MRKTGDLTAERLREVLDYNPETGLFVWRFARRGVRAGALAGSADPNGCRYIRIDQCDYLARRLAWFYVHGAWPSEKIRQANGALDDNRISNLVDVSPSGRPKGRFDHSTTEGRVAYMKARRTEFPDLYREKNLAKKFGISLADYQRMFVEQKGVCAICAKPETATRGGKTKWLAVDHDHVTGDVRGLLCSNCNPMLGYAQESVEVLTNATAYLKLHSLATCIRENVVPIKKVNTDG